MAFGLSAGAVSLIGMGAGALLGGGGGGAKQDGNQVVTQQQQLDPRIAAAIFGSGGGQRVLKPGVQPQLDELGHQLNPESDYTTDGGSSGLLGRYTGMLDRPQDPMMAQYGDAMQHYLGQAPADMRDMRQASGSLMGSQIAAPRMGAASMSAPGSMQGATVAGIGPMQTSRVVAPSQNNLDLSGAYAGMIGGNAGANPYLTRALQSGVDQTNASYEQNQKSLTDNLMRNILPSIGSDAVLSGQYGGSRQGIAEGNALGDYTKQLTNANLQLGLGNSANTTGQQANAFNQGQDRSLSAMSGLGAQQYGVAQQNSAQQQQGYQTSYQGALAKALADAGYQQQANQTNYTGQLTTNQNNAGFTQDAGKTNVGSGIATNNLNSGNQLAGIGATSGLLGTAYGAGANQDSYALNHAGQVNGLLAPYLGLNGTTTTSQPLYTNQGGNILGGALAGGALGRMVNGSNTGGLLGNFTDNNGGGQFISNLVGWGGPNATL